MTKVDSEAIAEVIKEVQSWPKPQTMADVSAEIDTVASRLVEVYARGDEHFDQGRFLRACGIEPIC